MMSNHQMKCRNARTQVLAAMAVVLVALLTAACGTEPTTDSRVSLVGTPVVPDEGQRLPINGSMPATESEVSPAPGGVAATATGEAPNAGQETAEPTALPEKPPDAGTWVQKLIAPARADAAGRLSLRKDNINITIFYTQVLLLGFEILLEAEGREREYHTDARQSAILREEQGMGDIPSVTDPIGRGTEEMVNQAREDLARRLSVPADQVEVLEVRAVVWPDSSLGCPKPGRVYAQVLQEGLLIRLSVDREMFFYHSGGTQAPFLCEGTSHVVPKITPKADEFVPPPDSEID
jgi:hypothetical protein